MVGYRIRCCNTGTELVQDPKICFLLNGSDENRNPIALTPFRSYSNSNAREPFKIYILIIYDWTFSWKLSQMMIIHHRQKL